MYLKEGGKPRVLFYCGHPAHFHLIKNSESNLQKKGYFVKIAIKSKDVLEDLVQDFGIPYYKISNLTSSKRLIKYFDAITRLINYAIYIKRKQFDLLVGTSWENSQIGDFLSIPSICLNEDDVDVVPLFARNAYPKAHEIITPVSCRVGEFEVKTIKIHSFHELAYLHPNNFTPYIIAAEKYIDSSKPYFIIRFENYQPITTMVFPELMIKSLLN